MRQENPHLLLVDTGDLLHPPSFTPRPITRQAGELRAELFVKAYNRMGYDAFTPGELDLAFGIQALKQGVGGAEFPVLLTNLWEASSGKPVFQAFWIKELAGVKVGLLGLISRDLLREGPAEEKERYRVADPVEAARKYIRELKKRDCQVIVALVHMEFTELEKLARALPDIHFLLAGHAPFARGEPEYGSRSFHAGSRGERLGQVEFFFRQKKLHFHYRLLPLSAQHPDHPPVKEMVETYKGRRQAILNETPAAP